MHARTEFIHHAGIRALTALRDSIYRERIVPPDVLAWQEEQTRLAFQTGQAVAMRNWPYAYPLLSDPAASRVAGRFAVALMPHAAGGIQVATLGGQQLAINARSRHPDAAYALLEHLTSPDQMLDTAAPWTSPWLPPGYEQNFWNGA